MLRDCRPRNGFIVGSETDRQEPQHLPWWEMKGLSVGKCTIPRTDTPVLMVVDSNVRYILKCLKAMNGSDSDSDKFT